MRFRHAWRVSRMNGVVLLCCLSLACQKSTKKQIAVIPKATANLFWQSVHAGAVKGAWESDVDIAFPSSFYGACMHALPEEVRGGLGYDGDLLLSAFLAGK